MSKQALVGVDYEVFWSKDDYDLGKMTIAEYVTDERFEVLARGVCLEGGARRFSVHAEMFRGEGAPVFVAHNAAFDAAVFYMEHGFLPEHILCTRLLAKRVGVEGSRSLTALTRSVLSTHKHAWVRGWGMVESASPVDRLSVLDPALAQAIAIALLSEMAHVRMLDASELRNAAGDHHTSEVFTLVRLSKLWSLAGNPAYQGSLELPSHGRRTRESDKIEVALVEATMASASYWLMGLIADPPNPMTDFTSGKNGFHLDKIAGARDLLQRYAAEDASNTLKLAMRLPMVGARGCNWGQVRAESREQALEVVREIEFILHRRAKFLARRPAPAKVCAVEAQTFRLPRGVVQLYGGSDVTGTPNSATVNAEAFVKKTMRDGDILVLTDCDNTEERLLVSDVSYRTIAAAPQNGTLEWVAFTYRKAPSTEE